MSSQGKMEPEIETRIKRENDYLDKWEAICCLRFNGTMNEMNDDKETWIRLNGWAR